MSRSRRKYSLINEDEFRNIKTYRTIKEENRTLEELKEYNYFVSNRHKQRALNHITAYDDIEFSYRPKTYSTKNQLYQNAIDFVLLNQFNSTFELKYHPKYSNIAKPILELLYLFRDNKINAEYYDELRFLLFNKQIYGFFDVSDYIDFYSKKYLQKKYNEPKVLFIDKKGCYCKYTRCPIQLEFPFSEKQRNLLLNYYIKLL